MPRDDLPDRRRMAVARATVQRILVDPALLQVGRDQLPAVRAHSAGGALALCGEWQALIDAGAEVVAAALVDPSDHGHDLGQQSPFAGVPPTGNAGRPSPRCIRMRWPEFAHAVRAAGAILDEDRVVVIGGQSVLGWFEDPPPDATLSREVGIAALDDPDDRKSHVLAGAVGEGSPFDAAFGFHVDGARPLPRRMAGALQVRHHRGHERRHSARSRTTCAWPSCWLGGTRASRSSRPCWEPGWWTGRPSWIAWTPPKRPTWLEIRRAPICEADSKVSA